MGNLVFLERFNGTLSNWTLYQGGGTVAIANVDYSNKMQLNDTSATDKVSATRTFAEPAGKYIVEYDMKYPLNGAGQMDLLSAGGTPLITVNAGATSNVASFSTDTAAASTLTFNNSIYKQVVLVINKANNTVSCYISADTDNSAFTADYGPLIPIATGKAYSGTAVASIRFSTAATQTGTVNVDEVKVYTPNIFVIGDSITDGKKYWSTHPQSPSRLGANASETSPPHWQLAAYLAGGQAANWIANRAFGGSTLAQADTYIQSTVIDHGAATVYLSEGHNDIGNGVTIAAMQASFNSIISKLQAAGITGHNIIVGNVIPGGNFSTDLLKSKRQAWNTWLLYRAKELGIAFCDNDLWLRDPNNYEAIKAGWVDTTDNVHLLPAGTVVLEQSVNTYMKAYAYSGNNILRGAPTPAGQPLDPQGYFVPSGIFRPADLNGLGGAGIFRTYRPLD